jgi:hypothetical protein
MEIINMKTDFSNIKNLLEETTEEDKPMTYQLIYKNDLMVVKSAEYDKSIYDYIIVNECKPIFNMNQIEDLRIFKSLYDIDEDTNEVYKCKDKRYRLLYIMKYIHNSSMISDNIDILKNPTILHEYIKCALFRGIFRVTDFCSRNVLISDNKVYSIDENAIGKQYEVIKKRDINRYIKKNIDLVILNNILEDFTENYEEKIEQIKKILIKYNKEDLFALIEYHFRFIKKDIIRDIFKD